MKFPPLAVIDVIPSDRRSRSDFVQSIDTAKRILNIYDYVWCFVVF